MKNHVIMAIIRFSDVALAVLRTSPFWLAWPLKRPDSPLLGYLNIASTRLTLAMGGQWVEHDD